MFLQAVCIISLTSVNSNRGYSPETLNLGKIDDFLAVWPWNWTDDLEKQ